VTVPQCPGWAVPPAAQTEYTGMAKDHLVFREADVPGRAIAHTLAAESAILIGEPIAGAEEASDGLEVINEAERPLDGLIVQNDVFLRKDLFDRHRNVLPSLSDDLVHPLLARTGANIGRHLEKRLVREGPALGCQSRSEPVGRTSKEEITAGGLEEEIAHPLDGQELDKVIDDPGRVESMNGKAQTDQIVVRETDISGLLGDLLQGDKLAFEIKRRKDSLELTGDQPGIACSAEIV